MRNSPDVIVKTFRAPYHYLWNYLNTCCFLILWTCSCSGTCRQALHQGLRAPPVWHARKVQTQHLPVHQHRQQRGQIAPGRKNHTVISASISQTSYKYSLSRHIVLLRPVAFWASHPFWRSSTREAWVPRCPSWERKTWRLTLKRHSPWWSRRWRRSCRSWGTLSRLFCVESRPTLVSQ